MENLGLTHKDRQLKELDASYFKIDERSIDDFINFAAKFAQFINYYNSKNDLDGDATSFIAQDTTILLIHISSYKIDAIRKNLENIISEVFNNKTELISVVNYLYDLIIQVETWNNITVDIKEFNNEIKKLIQSKFVKNFAKLMAFEDSLTLKGLIKPKLRFYNFLAKEEWMSDFISKERFIYTAETKEKLLQEVVNHIYHIFYPLTDAIQLLIDSSKHYLEKTKTAGNTQAHIALYITFIELYKYAQDDINKFTQRHLDYFYKEILKFENIPEVPDKVHLTFELQDGTDIYKLEKGTELIAGQDDEGKNIIFETNEEIVVTKADIESVKTIINDPNTTNKIDSNYENVLITKNINKDLFQEEKLEDSYEMGFAIATSFLKLAEGQRDIKFTIQLQRHAFDNFLNLYNKEILGNVKINIYDINQFIENLFTFSYTIPSNEIQEWFTIPKKNIKTKFQKNNEGNPINKLDIFVTVDTLYPPIDICISEEYPNAKKRQLPLCKFFINPEKFNFYNYYKILVIDKIDITTTVLGVRDLKIQNDYGSLDTEFPFEPFSAVPSIGSTFYLGHETIFSRKLNDIQIILEWNNVPLLENGFPEYYDGYQYIDSNQTFKAAVSVLKDRRWIPEENKQVVSLFEDIDDEDGVPVNNMRIIDDLDLQKINSQFKGAPKINNDKLYSRISKNGFLKLEFIYPPTGFGQTEYPEIIKQQAYSSIKKKTIPDTINEPWTPTLRSVSINYESTVTIDFGNQEHETKAFLYHLLPFGRKLVSEPIGKDVNILPNYNEGAEIYLAIRKFNTNEVFHLYININKFAVQTSEPSKTKITWSYLRNDTWQPISQKIIIKDTTNNLTNSGIITFNFPEIDPDYFNKNVLYNNNILPANLFFIRLYSSGGVDFINKLYTFKANGTMAEYVEKGNSSEHLNQPLPANTIAKFHNNHPGIKIINQEFPSFGGKAKETREEFQIRVSERLNHKDRMINKWDYEHIILQEFPDISKVICLNNTNIKLQNEPGSVLIVTIPNISKIKKEKIIQPKITELELLKIREVIKKRTSTFVNLEITNPIYEQIQVKFEVKFLEGLNARYYLQKINEDLKDFINPWIKNPKGQQLSSSEIHSVHIVYFLEKLDYVDYVTNLASYHIVDNLIINLDVANHNNTVLLPSTKISIFVSVAEHIISVVGKKDMQEAIGTMIVGKDFTTASVAEKKIIKGLEKSEIQINYEIEGDKLSDEIEEEYVVTF